MRCRRRSPLTDPEVAVRLRALLASAPLRDQDGMHLLQLARRWEMAPERVVASMLDAVTSGC